MIPSDKWFPTTLAARVLWLKNFIEQFLIYAAGLGFTPAEITAMQQDVEDFQATADAVTAVDALKSAIREYRISFSEGDIGDPDPVFPTGGITAPPNNRPAGFFERLDKARDRILAAPTYAPEIGAAMNILGTGPAPEIDPESVQPTLDVFPAELGGYLFTVVVGNRAASDMWIVSVTPVGVNNWQTLATATGKSIDVVYSPTPEQAGKPVQLQVRIQLRKQNANYGQPSQIEQVTINP